MPILVMTLVASLEKEIFVVFVVLKKDQEIKSCEKKKKNYCSIFSRVRKISFAEKCFHTFFKIDSGNLFTFWIVVLDVLSLLRTLMLHRLHPPHYHYWGPPPPATQSSALEKEIHSSVLNKNMQKAKTFDELTLNNTWTDWRF